MITDTLALLVLTVIVGVTVGRWMIGLSLAQAGGGIILFCS